MTASTKILSPRIRLSFGSDGIPLSALSTIVQMTADALYDLGLADRSAECTITNDRNIVMLYDPQGTIVWSRVLDAPVVDPVAVWRNNPNLKGCQAGRDGECNWAHCPQLVDHKSTCPRYRLDDGDNE